TRSTSTAAARRPWFEAAASSTAPVRNTDWTLPRAGRSARPWSSRAADARTRPAPTLESAPVCGRFTNTGSKTDEIHRRLVDGLGIELPDDERGYRRFNIAPTQEVLGVVEDAEGRRMDLLRWGLMPRWAKDAKSAYKMINARAETIAERPAYRGLVRRSRHRCLILADGYYEWQKPEDPRQPRS